mgnify:CR=1 FL=1
MSLQQLTQLLAPVACKAIRDTHGTLWRVPAANTVKIKGKLIDGAPQIDVWWDRDVAFKDNEHLIIRQENATDRADVLTLTLAQAYDLLHAIATAIKTP